MMRVVAAVFIGLLCVVAARADDLPVMSDDAARNLGLQPGDYTTESVDTLGGKAGGSAGAKEPVVRPNGLTDDQQRLISGSDLGASGRGRTQPATRGPRRDTGPNGVASGPVERPRTPANTQPAGPPTPTGSPTPTDATSEPGNTASAPPQSAQAPRVNRASTSRIESKLQGMKGAIGGLNEDAGQLGGPAKSAAPDAAQRAAGPRTGPGPEAPSDISAASGRPSGDAVSEPRALMRRPDLYNVIPRSRYQSVKDSYAATGGARPEFRDMGVNDRDITWTRSCDRVSGGCNPLAAEKSYKKNDEVSPETLANVWKKLKESSASGEEDGWADYVKEQRKTYEESLEREAKAESIRAKLSRSIFAAGSRLGGMLRSLASAARGGGFVTYGSSADGATAGGSGEGAVVAGAAARTRAASRSSGVVGGEEELPLPTKSASLPWGRIAFALLGASVFALAIRFMRKRRDEDARVRLAPLIKGRDEEKP